MLRKDMQNLTKKIEILISYLLFSAQTPLLESVHLLFSFFLFFLSLTLSQTRTYISCVCLKSLVSSDKLISGSFVMELIS